MSTSTSLGWLKPSVIPLYGVAVLSVAGAIVAGRLIHAYLHTEPYVSLFICAIVFAAWLGGVGPGLLASALSILAFEYYFVFPIASFDMAVNELPRVVLFEDKPHATGVCAAASEAWVGGIRV